jgi:hypothetical protein
MAVTNSEEESKKLYGISYKRSYGMPMWLSTIRKYDTIDVHSLDIDENIYVDIVVMITDVEYELLKKQKGLLIHHIDKIILGRHNCKNYVESDVKSYLSNISDIMR